MNKLKILIASLCLAIHGVGCSAANSGGARSDHGCGLEVEIVDFDGQGVDRCGDAVCAINQSIFYGSDGALPTTRLSKLVVQIQDRQYALETGGMYNPGVTQENLCERIEIIPFWGGFYKVLGTFSDGAGAYAALWTVGHSASIRNWIGGLDDLADLKERLERQEGP